MIYSTSKDQTSTFYDIKVTLKFCHSPPFCRTCRRAAPTSPAWEVHPWVPPHVYVLPSLGCSILALYHVPTVRPWECMLAGWGPLSLHWWRRTVPQSRSSLCTWFKVIFPLILHFFKDLLTVLSINLCFKIAEYRPAIVKKQLKNKLQAALFSNTQLW